MIRDLFAPERTVLLPYLTAGLPDPSVSADLFAAMADAGADGFEIGIPYSDPLMDGPVIQAASAAALEAGTDLEKALGVIRQVVERTGRPALAMTYANVVFRTGPDEFCRRLAATGAQGVIVPDMPLEEAAPVEEAAADHGLGVVISTPEQAAAAGEVADGVIVGTALVRRVLEAATPDDAAKSLHEAVKALKAAL